MNANGDEKDNGHAPDFQWIRRKRSRPPEIYHNALHGTRVEKAPRLMVLPRLAEILTQRKPRYERVDSLWGVLSHVPTVDQRVQLTQQEEKEVEDKTPWPSAKQYHDILSNPKSNLNIPMYDLGVDARGVPLHPEFIYTQPVSCMYFLKCARLLGKGSFGFPRKKRHPIETTAGMRPPAANKIGVSRGRKSELSKDFEWRKMSFVTGLPKNQPFVRYVTATCYSRANDIAAKKKVFRMHAVMLANKEGTGETGACVLVHIRAGGYKRVGLRTSLASAEAQLPSASAHTFVNDNQKLCMRGLVSPTSVAVSSYSSTMAPTSPQIKKLLHAEFTVNQGESSYQVTKKLKESSVISTSSVARYPLFTTFHDPNVHSARLALRNMIMKSCSSRDEIAKYAMGLQEELASLQSQN
ncbi:hypothetical protein PsorP6_002812 [Peronosclerospora sorghi]|uniref:Uncharacterized protein n=1 Tax=Peronosclerospora sorghi TaxID=230839 RepID=A0ACC0VM35_9STRA|nr:hypothetical protein PsorP6_002812 [Peronosclerospora sorghi]